jgi:uncharacterized phage protein (TIGR02218 family)
MPFSDYELSVEDSQPAELYEFSYQGGTLRFTSADRDIEFASNNYRAIAIDHSPVTETSDIAKASITITAPPDFEVAQLFEVAPPDDVVGLVIRRLQIVSGDTEAIWLGRILSARWPKSQSELRGESIYTQMNQLGLRRIYSKNCPHVLYSTRCGASQSAFEVDTSIDTQVGRVITSSTFGTFPDGYFAGGKIIWESTPGYTQKRGIKLHVGDDIVVTHPFPEIPNGAAITIAPGCDHTLNHCGPKFANEPNYGGMPGMKLKNPFGQSSVF